MIKAVAEARGHTECKVDLHYDAFLSHDWGVDSEGRNNHARVSKINKALRDAGVRTWFDEEQMHGALPPPHPPQATRTARSTCLSAAAAGPPAAGAHSTHTSAHVAPLPTTRHAPAAP